MTERQKRVVRDIDGTTPSIEMTIETDPIDMSIKNTYKIDGVICPKIILESQQAKNFAAYSLIKKDLKFIKKSFEYAMSIASNETDVVGDGVSLRYRPEVDVDSDILKALYISAVVTYGKCFTKAEGRKVKIDSKNLFKKSGNDLILLHEELMTQRHQYLAHGGRTQYEKTNAIVVLHPIKKNATPLLMTECAHVAAFGKKDFEKYLELIEFVENFVNEILSEKAKKLYQNEVGFISIEELYKKSIR